MLKLGDSVYLKACRGVGKPGKLIRFERGRFTVFWADMDFWSRHPEAALELADSKTEERIEAHESETAQSR